jgi:hypothetical protein
VLLLQLLLLLLVLLLILLLILLLLLGPHPELHLRLEAARHQVGHGRRVATLSRRRSAVCSTCASCGREQPV